MMGILFPLDNILMETEEWLDLEVDLLVAYVTRADVDSIPNFCSWRLFRYRRYSPLTAPLRAHHLAALMVSLLILQPNTRGR